MLTDSGTIETNTELAADVCIVGAGAAGITIALQLLDSGAHVVLLEGGKFGPTPESQDLYRGAQIGHPTSLGLEGSRLRYFGGATNHWTGFCRPFDRIDFEKREWVPDSGWPIDRDEMEPFYRTSARLCELQAPDLSAESLQERGATPLPLRPERIKTVAYQYSPPTRFGERYREQLITSPRVQIVLDASAIEFRRSPDSRAIERVRVGNVAGNRFAVSARVFVLATGGIENARLLLASSALDPAGLGNEHDLVGRFFADHPHLVAGYVLPLEKVDLSWYQYRAGRPELDFSLAFAIPAEVMERERLLQFSSSIARPRRVGDDASHLDALSAQASLDYIESHIQRGTFPADITSHLWRVIRDLDQVLGSDPGDELKMPTDQPLHAVNVRSEQSPNPQSRVTLGDERDALGIPRVKLDWQLTDGDLDSIRRGQQLLAAELGYAGLGRVFFPPDDDERSWQDSIVGGCHHMGTTRMHADPRHGVVDANCRVHSTSNLYVAGSSVFPTSGYANPTLTLVALAARLAEFIGRKLR